MLQIVIMLKLVKFVANGPATYESYLTRSENLTCWKGKTKIMTNLSLEQPPLPMRPFEDILADWPEWLAQAEKTNPAVYTVLHTVDQLREGGYKPFDEVDILRVMVVRLSDRLEASQRAAVSEKVPSVGAQIGEVAGWEPAEPSWSVAMRAEIEALRAELAKSKKS